MPKTLAQLRHIFAYMTKEGVILTFSTLLGRVKQLNRLNQGNGAMIADILWILEDFAAGEDEEVREILDTGIVARVFHVFEEATSMLAMMSQAELNSGT